jgi:TonB-dependent receptor
LVKEFEISEATVRRDLATLEALGRVVRTFGGARSRDESSFLVRSFSQKSIRMQIEKQQIAHAHREDTMPFGVAGPRRLPCVLPRHSRSTSNAHRTHMNPYKLILCFGLYVAAALGLANAQTDAAPPGVSARTATGTITGRVQNSVTGQFLNNARVSIRGTNIIAFTDDTGTYLIATAPTGPVVLDFFYTGLDAQQILVTVVPNQGVERDVALTTAAREGRVAGTVKLDAFVVSSSRNADGEALSTNEQRFAPNIKNVVAADSFGAITENNVAEFMKFLPGVSIEYTNATPMSVGVRGLSSAVTGVTADGTPLALGGEMGRGFNFSQTSMNNVSRIEVTKVPTPSMPADSLGGAINMVSKSAFEKRAREFVYRVFLSANSDALTLRRTPYPPNRQTYKTLPGFDFDYTLPVNKNFGIVITGAVSSQYNTQNGARMLYNATGTNINTSSSNPYFQQFNLFDAPKYLFRQSLSGKVDWRPTPHSVLSFGGQAGHYTDYNRSFTLVMDAGTNGAPTIASGKSMSFGNDFVNGATGRGSITQTGSSHVTQGLLEAANIRYRFDDGLWKIDAGAGFSTSKWWQRVMKYGNFFGLNVTTAMPIRLSFLGIHNKVYFSDIQAFANNDQAVDIDNINSYQLNSATVPQVDGKETRPTVNASVRRQLNFLPFPLALQLGGLRGVQDKDMTKQSINWNYAGPNGNQSAAPYLMPYTSGSRNGLQNIPWASPFAAYQAWQNDPSLFYKTPAQKVTEATFYIANSVRITEVIDAGYLQSEARLFGNRLNVLGGVRYERTTDSGVGPLVQPDAVWVRRADGSFALNASGQRIRKPEAGAVGSMEELLLVRHERGYSTKRSYDGYYPSLHLTANVTSSFLFRAAYAETYGRPNFANIIPNTTINENDLQNVGDPTAIKGTISVRNPGLKPWTAKNYDLSAEYYNDKGGLITVGVFRKDIRDFFGSRTKIATAADLADLSLDPRYVGWQLTTSINAGQARVSGAEFNVKQSLGLLGPWGSYFSVFANGSRLLLEGNRRSDFSNFIPKMANYGVTYTKRPVTIMARWTYRGETWSAALPSLGSDAAQYVESRTTLDLNVEYQLGNRHMTAFANIRNLFNVPANRTRYGSQTPAYARQIYETFDYGAQWSVGIKGSF